VDVHLAAVAGHRLAVHGAGPVLTAHRIHQDLRGRLRPHGLEDLHLLVAHGVRLERHRRLHRHEAQELENVVLDDVAEDAGLFVEAPAPFDADRLRHRDLHVVDVAAVPERLEDAVAEAEDEDVLRRLLAEVVIDAERLPLAEDLRDLLVQRLGRLEVPAERLLDDEPRPGAAVHGIHEARVTQVLHHGRDRRRRHREIEKPVARSIALLLQRLEAGLEVRQVLGHREVASEEVEARLEGRPFLLVERLDAGELRDRRLHLGAVGLSDSPFAPDGVRARDALEVVEGRHELPLRGRPPPKMTMERFRGTSHCALLDSVLAS
jgi:hypothetical protein